MPKVTFEFDECEDRQDVLEIVNRHSLMSALYDISDLYRRVYNGKIYGDNDVIFIKEDGSKATDEDYENALTTGESIKGDSYIRREYLERELDSALEKVRHLLDY